MKHSSRQITAALGALLLGITGCSHDQFPAYSSSIKYGLRQDPILMQPAAKLGDERHEPDLPTQLPIMNLDGAFTQGHPYLNETMNKQAAELFIADSVQQTGDDLLARTEAEVAHNPVKFKKYLGKALEGPLRDPRRLSTKDQAELETALEAAFGTPAKPTVNAEVLGLEPETIKILQLEDDKLAKGSTRYRIHCLHCHGVAGDGRGQTARWINPHPRDFRLGQFKFQSVNQLESKPGAPLAHAAGVRPPARADLLRTLRNGLEGTAMPTFGLLQDDELEWITSYVIHLAIRGQVELEVIKSNFDFDAAGGTLTFKVPAEDDPATITEAVKQAAGYIAERSYLATRDPKKDQSWRFSQKPELAIKPGEFPAKLDMAASVLRGKQLFIGDVVNHPGKQKAKSANCVSCHTDFGRQARFRFDDWGTLVRPNNFTAGTFRGGRRPVDMYYRIHSGINGSGMANFGSVLDPDDIWDLINFVSTLPYPHMQEKEKQAVKLN